MSFHVVAPGHRLCARVFHPGNFSCAPTEIRDSNVFLYSSIMGSFGWHSRWVHPKYTWSRNEVGLSRSTFFINFIHSGATFCFFPAFWISSTYTDKNSPYFLVTKRHSQFGTLSHPSSINTSSNCLSHKSLLQEEDLKDFVQEERLGLPCWTMIFGHLCRGRRIPISVHSDFGIFNSAGASSILTWVYGDTVSAACPVHPGSLAITSITFTAVICDAAGLCSVNTA